MYSCYVISLDSYISVLSVLCIGVRYLINPDQSLQIHYVTLQDAGRYTCTAVNDVGESNASAQLFVDGKRLVLIIYILFA